MKNAGIEFMPHCSSGTTLPFAVRGLRPAARGGHDRGLSSAGQQCYGDAGGLRGCGAVLRSAGCGGPITAGMRRLAEDDALRARLAAAGPARAARYTWEAAAQVLAVMREVVGR